MTAGSALRERFVALGLTLFGPLDGVPLAVRARRWGLPLLLSIAAGLFAAGALATRLDARSSALAEMEMSGELKDATDRDVTEKIDGAKRLASVQAIARAIVLPPAGALGMMLFLLLAAKLAGGKAPAGAAWTAACAALVPGIVRSVLSGVAALQRTAVSPQDAAGLVSASAAPLVHGGGVLVGKLLGQIDLFALWSALLLGLGLAAASKLPRARSLAASLVGLACWAMLAITASGGHGGHGAG